MLYRRSWLILALAVVSCLVLTGCGTLDQKVNMDPNDPHNRKLGWNSTVISEIHADEAGGWHNGNVTVIDASVFDSIASVTGSAANAGAAYVGFNGLKVRGSTTQNVRYSGAYTVNEPDLAAAGASLADGIYGAGKEVGDGLATQGAAQADGMVGAAQVRGGRR